MTDREALSAKWRASAENLHGATNNQGEQSIIAWAREATFIQCADELDTLPLIPVRAWQPIATAPKNGTRLLAWRDSGIHIVRWKVVDGHADGGFWDEWHAKLSSLTIQPTHWMPLPSPPVEDRTTNTEDL